MINKKGPALCGSYINRISHRTHLILDSTLKPFGITHQQGKLIAFIGNHEKDRDVFQHELQNVFQLRRSSITSLLNNIEKKGLIIRLCDLSDARVKKIVLTDSARALLVDCKLAVDSIEANIVEHMTETQQLEFAHLLQIALKNLEE